MPGIIVKPNVIFIIGPTAVGKTRVSVKLARRIKGEIISADSMQVYKGMAVISQAPRRADTSGVRHHLVAMLDPSSDYNVNVFRKKATEAIRAIVRRGRVPIIVGGSGLYVKALVDGLFPSPEADMAFRKKTERFIKKHGSPSAHKRLEDIDPASASKIHPNDARRIIRALEIYHTTGRTMSELKSQTSGIAGEFRVKIFGLKAPREEIYRLIEDRVDSMFGSGLIGEVKKLCKKRLSKTSSSALGIKEVTGFLRKEYGEDRAKEMLKMNTRRFAKRQFTWFKPDKRIKWIDTKKNSDLKIINMIKRKAL